MARKGYGGGEDDEFDSPAEYAEWYYAEFCGGFVDAIATEQHGDKWVVTLRRSLLSGGNPDETTEVVVWIFEGVYHAEGCE